MNYIKLFTPFVLIILFLGGCTPKIEKISYEKFDFSNANLIQSSWNEIKGFENVDFQGSLDAFLQGCQRSARFELLKSSCENAKISTNPKEFFTTNFTPYKMYDDKHSNTGLMTGYFESMLYGSLIKTERYKYPIYKIPNDIFIIDMSEVYPELGKYRLRGRIQGNKIVPYYSREEINNRDEKNYEVIAYVDDEVELFFLHIQGSGKVKFEDGTIINVGYGIQNGHKYYAIGRTLVQMGELKQSEVSLQTIASWLQNNPDKKDEILNLNQSYIFFTTNKKGATGSLGTELIPRKNIAVDRTFVPLGLPVFINTSHPITKEPIDDIVIAADTGGAIKGEIRGDFFWGYGEEAKEAAGVMKEPFEMYIFVPNNTKNQRK